MARKNLSIATENNLGNTDFIPSLSIDMKKVYRASRSLNGEIIFSMDKQSLGTKHFQGTYFTVEDRQFSTFGSFKGFFTQKHFVNPEEMKNFKVLYKHGVVDDEGNSKWYKTRGEALDDIRDAFIKENLEPINLEFITFNTYYCKEYPEFQIESQTVSSKKKIWRIYRDYCSEENNLLNTEELSTLWDKHPISKIEFETRSEALRSLEVWLQSLNLI